MRVLIDSDKPVNAYDIAIIYNKDVADIESLDTSRSIVTIMPAPIRAKEGKIIIKGGSAQAFTGTGGELATIILKPVDKGVVTFDVTRAMAYQADGKGTELVLDSTPLSLAVTDNSFVSYAQSKEAGQNIATDVTPPEITLAKLYKNPLQTDEQLLVFQANDSGSGVARYEARDMVWASWSPWHEAVNPYPTDAGAWMAQIQAIDNSGNSALRTIFQPFTAMWKFGILIAFIILVIWFIIKRHRT